MSKWISETTELPSKVNLKQYRKVVWNGLLELNNLDIDLCFWWTDIEQQTERELWAEADNQYEKRKARLKAALEKLTKAKRGIYFKEIGLPMDTDVSAYLTLSSGEGV